MDYQTILYEKRDAIAKVTLNRPRYKNAQSRLNDRRNGSCVYRCER